MRISLTFSNSKGHDRRDVIVGFRKSQTGYANIQRVTQVSNGLRKYPKGYANIQRVTQPVILLCLFQYVIEDNMIDINKNSADCQWHCLVVTVSDW